MDKRMYRLIDQPERAASPPQKSSQSNRGIGEAVAAAIVVVTPAEDVDGTDDSRSNVSQLGVGGAAAAAAGAGCCWKFRRCDTGGGRGGRCGARALACPFAFAAPLPLALGVPAAFLARMASSVSTYFCTRFSCTIIVFVTVGSGLSFRRRRSRIRSRSGDRLVRRGSTDLHSPLHLDLAVGGDGVQLDQLVHERLGEGHHVGVHHLAALAHDGLQRRHLRRRIERNSQGQH